MATLMLPKMAFAGQRTYRNVRPYPPRLESSRDRAGFSKRWEGTGRPSSHWRIPGRPWAPYLRAKRGWDEAARDWDIFVENRKDYHRWEVHGRALVRAVAPVRGLRVLDLGCGQGWFSRQLASRGAYVIGLDWSPEMIAIAKEHERRRKLGVKYLVVDAAKIGRRWSRGSFDLITSCMAFMDMPRLDSVMAGAARLLRPNGRLVFSVAHPVNNTPGTRWLRPQVGHHGPLLIDRYFDEGPVYVGWKLRGTERVLRVPNWHRTFAGWFQLLHEGNLVVTRLWEPRPTALQARKRLGFEGARRIPFYLIFEARPKPAGWA